MSHLLSNLTGLSRRARYSLVDLPSSVQHKSTGCQREVRLQSKKAYDRGDLALSRQELIKSTEVQPSSRLPIPAAQYRSRPKEVKVASSGTAASSLESLFQISAWFPRGHPVPSPLHQRQPSPLPANLHSLLALWLGNRSSPSLRLLAADRSDWMDAPHSFSPVKGSSSRNHGSASCRFVTASDLQSMQGLKNWLGERIPRGGSVLDSWGRQRGTKCLANLWAELVEGEACLSDSSPPCRAVNVVSVRVRHPVTGKLLVEARQLMQDGSVRERNRPLSEKMRPGESVEEASLRGVLEELGTDLGNPSKVTLIPESMQTEYDERDSFSYPGLPSRYTVHTIVARIEGLPDGPFSTVEGEGGVIKTCTSDPKELDSLSSGSAKTTGVQVHFWDWVDCLPTGTSGK